VSIASLVPIAGVIANSTSKQQTVKQANIKECFNISERRKISFTMKGSISALQSQMKKQFEFLFKPQQTPRLKDYPWILSAEADQAPIPTIWESFKRKHNIQIGTQMASKLLKEDAYAFPSQFNKDVTKTLDKTFKLLSNEPTKKQLEAVMTDALASLYASKTQTLIKFEKYPKFEFNPLKIKINSFHFTFGPLHPDFAQSNSNPDHQTSNSNTDIQTDQTVLAPNIQPNPNSTQPSSNLQNNPKYKSQQWFDFLTINLPEQHSIFHSHQRQNELLKIAKSQGVHFKINTTIQCDLQFAIFNKNDLPLVRDQRDFINVDFTSPHFTPFDEIFVLQGDGSWRLCWDWKIVDIDGVAERFMQ
jgi:hypothetical protein